MKLGTIKSPMLDESPAYSHGQSSVSGARTGQHKNKAKMDFQTFSNLLSVTNQHHPKTHEPELSDKEQAMLYAHFLQMQRKSNPQIDQNSMPVKREEAIQQFSGNSVGSPNYAAHFLDDDDDSINFEKMFARGNQGASNAAKTQSMIAAHNVNQQAPLNQKQGTINVPSSQN